VTLSSATMASRRFSPRAAHRSHSHSRRRGLLERSPANAQESAAPRAAGIAGRAGRRSRHPGVADQNHAPAPSPRANGPGHRDRAGTRTREVERAGDSAGGNRTCGAVYGSPGRTRGTAYFPGRSFRRPSSRLSAGSAVRYRRSASVGARLLAGVAYAHPATGSGLAQATRPSARLHRAPRPGSRSSPAAWTPPNGQLLGTRPARARRPRSGPLPEAARAAGHRLDAHDHRPRGPGVVGLALHDFGARAHAMYREAPTAAFQRLVDRPHLLDGIMKLALRDGVPRPGCLAEVRRSSSPGPDHELAAVLSAAPPLLPG